LVRGLRDALRDAYWQVQKEAIASLGRLFASSAAPEISAFLLSTRSEMRRAAAYALGDLCAESAVEGLRALSEDPDIEVRKAAFRALDAIAAG